MTTPGHAEEPISLAGTGTLLGTTKLQEAIDKFAATVEKLEKVATQLQSVAGKGGNAGGATATGYGLLGAAAGGPRTANAGGPVFSQAQLRQLGISNAAPPSGAASVGNALGQIFGGSGGGMSAGGVVTGASGGGPTGFASQLAQQFSPTSYQAPGSGASPSGTAIAGNANAGGARFTTISGAKVPSGPGSIAGVPRNVVGGVLGAVATLANFGAGQLGQQVDLNAYVGTQLMTSSSGGNMTNKANQIRNQALGGSMGNASGNMNAIAFGVQDALQGQASINAVSGFGGYNLPSYAQGYQSAAQTAAYGYGVANPSQGYAAAGQFAEQMLSPDQSMRMKMMGIQKTPLTFGGGSNPSGVVNQSVLQRMSGGRGYTPKQLGFTFRQGGIGTMDIEAMLGTPGQDTTQVQSYEQELMMQNKADIKYGDTRANQLISQAAKGNTGAQNQLQAAGIPRTSVQDIKNLGATKSARSSDIAQSFDAGLQAATSALTSFNKILNSIANTAIGKAVLGYGGGAAGGLSSLTNPSNIIGGLGSGAELFGGAQLAKKFLGGGGGSSGSGVAADAATGEAVEGGAATGAVTTTQLATLLPIAVSAATLAAFTEYHGFGTNHSETLWQLGDNPQQGNSWDSQFSTGKGSTAMNSWAKLFQDVSTAGGGKVNKQGKTTQPGVVGSILSTAFDPFHELVPGMARGGVIPGYAPGKDTEHTMLSKGESVLTPEATAGVGGKKTIDAINQKFTGYRTGKEPGYAAGGMAGDQGVAQFAERWVGIIPYGAAPGVPYKGDIEGDWLDWSKGRLPNAHTDLDCGGFVNMVYEETGLRKHGGAIDVIGLKAWGKEVKDPQIGGFGSISSQHVELIVGENKTVQSSMPGQKVNYGDFGGLTNFYIPPQGFQGARVGPGGGAPSSTTPSTTSSATDASGLGLDPGTYGSSDELSNIAGALLGGIGAGPSPTAQSSNPSKNTTSPAPGQGAGAAGPGLTNYIKAVLKGIGAPASGANITSMTDWGGKESIYPGGPGKGGKWNEWNTIVKMPGSTNYNNLGGGMGVQNYPSETEGIQATVKTLEMPNFHAIVSQLRTGKGLMGTGPWNAELGHWSGGGYTQVATGTRSAPRGMAWVGERGPELIPMAGGEQVYSAAQSQHLAEQSAKAPATPWTSILGQSFSSPPTAGAQAGASQAVFNFGDIVISGASGNGDQMASDFIHALQGKLAQEKLLLTIAQGQKLG